MPISLPCSACGTSIQAADDAAGTSVACPKCGSLQPVPAVASDAISAQPTRSRPRLDDDDDRPRRAPAKSGMPAWAIALIIVGVVGIAGLCVVAILAALLVPAVQKVRESAARAQTNNNLRQCALAVHGFHDNFRHLPDGFGPAKKNGVLIDRVGENRNISVWFHILPYVEQDLLFRDAQIVAVVPPFLAPSDPFSENAPGVVNFAANVRVFGQKTFGQNDRPGQALPIRGGEMLSGLNFGRVPDGTSNTIMLTTRYGSCAGQKTWYAADAVGGCELGALPGPGVGGFMGAGSSTTSATRDGKDTAIFQLAPTENQCVPQPGLFGHSFGPSGMSVALCDGSVRNIRPDMSPLTFARALSPADGQAMGVEWQDD